MRREYWKCERCGCETDEPVSGTRVPGDPDFMLRCPECGSTWIDEGKQCQFCGGWYADPEEEGFDGCCKKCLDEAVKAFEDYMKEDKPMDKYQKDVFWEYWGCL